RGLVPYDMPGVRRIVREAGEQDYRLSALIEGIIHNEAFLMRRTAPPQAEAQ
ncbi:MAG: DUF1585 domain-containing protein, partial [Acidobacteria bacterium]|nr:DUF1585 domain-containing protein [Acidobacteriota bacterium]